MKRDYEYIVVGLGGIGVGAAYWLARRAGRDVLGLEQFELGHVRGESQDHSRIIRLSYHTPEYVELARQAYQAWAALEEEAGEKLILKTGGLDFAPRVSAIPLDNYRQSLQACGVPYEALDAAEIMRRWPPFHLTDDIQGLFQSESGIAPAARCNAAHLRLSRQHGATLRDRAPVTAIRSLSGGQAGEIEVVAGDIAYRCRRLIVAAGPWTNRVLANFGMRLPLTITQEQVTYFATPHLADFQPDRFPIWIWMDDPCFYGFPAFGEPGPKVAQDVGGDEVTPESRTFEPNPATLQRTVQFLQRYLPTHLGPILYTKTCLYTLTPDRDFVIGAVPGHENCIVAVGAAHAFKFASLIGKILSDLALEGATASNIEPFKMDRPILLMENPPRNFMV